MSFKDIIKKDLRKNFRKYLSIFFSGTFCTAMFFVYTTMLLLDEVIESNREYPMKMLFLVTSVCVAVFSVFFLSYSHQTFVRNKKKELAIYLTIGMDEEEARKLLLTEASVAAVAAIFTGMILGTFFSRFFQLIITKMLSLRDLGFRLNIWNYVTTAVVFFLIYGVCFLSSDRKMKKEDIASMMKEQRKNEGKPYKTSDSVKSILGVFLSIFTCCFILIVAKNMEINAKPYVPITYLACGYIGLYLLIFYGGRTLLHTLKKEKQYYRNILPIKEVYQRYLQNTKIIFILAMLASVIVMLVGSPFALVNITDQIAEENRQDLQFTFRTEEEESGVFKLLSTKKISKRETSEVACITDENGIRKPVVKVSEYNRLHNKSLSVNDGEVYHLIITWKPGTLGVAPGTEYRITAGDTSFTYRVCASLKGEYEFNGLFSVESILILSDNDYEKVYPLMERYQAETVQFTDGWKNTGEIVENIIAFLTDENYVTSRIQSFHELKNGYSTFLFVSCSMCIMFFISTGGVIYFKQFNELDEDKKQYKRLYQIGISEREMRKTITKKLAVLYFCPLLGGIMGILNMYYLANLFGGTDIVSKFMNFGILGFFFYAISQLIFYLVLRSRYGKEVTALQE